MPLLNYTTEVAVARTVAGVHELLMNAGARQILSRFDEEGRPAGLAFAITTPYGLRNFTLPVNTDAVYKVMTNDKKIPPRYRNRPQAERVAWRIMKDWLEAQLAIIATEMVTLDQVMLPYMQTNDDGITFYERFLGQQMAIGTGE